MAERERSADAESEPDLRARIQARVAERRAARAAERGPNGRSAANGVAAADGVAAAAPAAEPADAAPAAEPADAAATPAQPSTARSATARSGTARSGTARSAADKPAAGKPAAQPVTWVSRLTSTLGFLLAVAVTVVVLRSFVVTSYYIPSASMEPTLHGCLNCQPDLVLVDKLSYRFSSVARSDVVVFDRPPLAPPEAPELIKRVIGLPGETISGRDGRVFIGDKALAEPYVHPRCGGTADFAAVKVPADKYFVMGDNRCDSLDSRVFGVIPGSSIAGRAVAVSWPVKHLRWL